MSTLAKTIRHHRESVRNRRAIADAIANAPSESMRSDLVMAAQRAHDGQAA